MPSRQPMLGLNGSELDLPSEKEQLEKAVAESLLSLKEEILPFCDSPSKTPKSSGKCKWFTVVI